MSDMRWFTLDEARGMVPTLRALAEELIEVRAELVSASDHHALADRKALEARLSDVLDRIGDLGVQIKGWAPLLVDFPLRHGDRVLLLCWLEGERDLEWYHEAEHGFAGRRRLDSAPEIHGA